MGRPLGSFADDNELDRPDLNKCPDCGCFFADLYCPLCGKECPEDFRAGHRKPVRHKRRRSAGDSGRVTFIQWYHSWWFIILMMLFMPIVGIILLFTSPHKTRSKVIFIAIAAAYTIVTSYGFLPLVSRVSVAFGSRQPVNQKLSREEYIAACTTVDPEAFYRSPDAYDGEFTAMTVTIVGRVIDSGYANETYYIAQNADGTVRFLLRDCQRGEQRNLIAGDTVTVYGEGAGNTVIYGTDGVCYAAPCLNVAFLTQKGLAV